MISSKAGLEQLASAVHYARMAIQEDRAKGYLNQRDASELTTRLLECEQTIKDTTVGRVSPVLEKVEKQGDVTGDDQTKLSNSAKDIQTLSHYGLLPKDTADDLLTKISRFIKLPTNRLANPVFPVCKNNERTKLWANLRLASDLALDVLKETGVSLGSIKVAVVDSGFDVSGNQKHVDVANLSVAYSGPTADPGNPSHDENGHGTAVSGTIVGKYGIGVAPGVQLRVFRVTKSGDTGSTSSERIENAITTACDQGFKIINVSWGGLFDERGDKPDEIEKKTLLETLRSKGCVVVKAAGNSSYRHDMKGMLGKLEYLDDAYLRVASTSSFGNMSGFSSRGEVTAPGGDIFSLTSTQKKYKPSGDDTCLRQDGHPEHGQFISGTSFSAPFTAGTLALVRAVLDTSPVFSSMSPEQQVAIQNRIIKSSQLGGSVRAYRAVLIAKKLAQTGGFLDAAGDLLALETLKRLLIDHPEPICSASLPVCVETDGPDVLRNCINQIRKFGLACPHKTGTADFRQLIQTLNRYRNLEISTAWMSMLINQGRMNPSDLLDEVVWTTQLYQDRWNRTSYFTSSRLNYYQAMEILPLMTEVLDAHNNQHRDLIKTYLDAMVGEYDFAYELGKQKERGGQSEVRRLATVLSRIFQKSGGAFFSTLLDEMVSKILKEVLGSTHSSGEAIKLIPVVRLLSHFLKETPALQPFIRPASDRVFTALFDPRIKIPKDFKGEKCDLVIAWFGDLTDFEPDDFTTFLSAHNASLFEQKLNAFFDDASIVDMGPLPILSVFAEGSRWSWADAKRFFERVFGIVNHGKGWGLSENNKVLERFFRSFPIYLKKTPGLTKDSVFTWVKDHYWPTIRNPSLFTFFLETDDLKKQLSQSEKLSAARHLTHFLKTRYDDTRDADDLNFNTVWELMKWATRDASFLKSASKTELNTDSLVSISVGPGEGTFDAPLELVNKPFVLPSYHELVAQTFTVALKHASSRSDWYDYLLVRKILPVYLVLFDKPYGEAISDRVGLWKDHARQLLSNLETKSDRNYYEDQILTDLRTLAGKITF